MVSTMAHITDKMFCSGIFPNSDDVIQNAVEKCLDAMYRFSYPSCTWQEYKDSYKGKTEEEAHDSKFYDAHYLPAEVYNEIRDLYLDRFHLENEWGSHIEILKSYLKDGGMKDVWVEGKDGARGYRGYEKTPKLEDVIGKDNAEKVFKLISDCKNFYRLDRTEDQFSYNVMNYSPCCNKEIVEKYWHDHGNPEFKIDDSLWTDVEPEEGDYEQEEESEPISKTENDSKPNL